MKVPCLIVFLFLAAPSFAAVHLNALFTDHMVLQRNHETPVYGTAGPGEPVTVEFAGQKKRATADADGRWQVILDPMTASAEPRELKVSSSIGNHQSKIGDVVVGDVWLCAGQSNMASMMKSYPTLRNDDVLEMTNSMVRLFKCMNEGVGSPAPSREVVVDPDFNDSWQVMSPSFARNFSATACFFGRALQPQAGVPVGLISANRGGTEVNMWLPMDFMQSKPALYARFLGRGNRAWTESEGNPGLIRAPAHLFNGTIYPLLPFAIRGVIWYQGESDCRNSDIYADLFEDLITVWRGLWGYDFPFLFVQIPPYQGDYIKWDVRGESWAFMREAQDRALALPNTGRAVIIDSGEQLDIHPQNKQPVGERLALLAAKLDNPAVDANSPEFETAETVGNKIRITFRYAGSGLITKRVAMNKNKRLEPGMDPEAFAVEADSLAGFTICGPDKKFVAAQAEIVAPDAVEVGSAEVKEPVAVRYGWADFPLCNLYNRAGLPASPFRTDHFPAPDFESMQSGRLIDNGGVLAGMLLSGSLALPAATVTDQFSRDDSQQSSDVSLIGSEWKQAGTGNQWFIKDGELHGRNHEEWAILYNCSTEIPKDGFIVRADVCAKEADVWAGVVFNYRDMDNYCVLRFKGGTPDYQLLSHIEGKDTVLAKSRISGIFRMDRFYTLAVQSSENRIFQFVIQEPQSSGILNTVTSAALNSQRETGGYAGLYFTKSVHAHNAKFDNFQFEASPVPAPGL